MQRAATQDFSDPEELSLTLRHTDVRAVQKSRGRFSARLSFVPLGTWISQSIQFNDGATACEGKGPTDRYAFIVPLKAHRGCRLLGLDVTGKSIGVYAPGSEHADTCSEGYSQVVLMPPPGIVSDASAETESLNLPAVGSHHVSVSQGALDHLRSVLARAMANGDQFSNAIAINEVSRSLNDELSSALKNAMATRYMGGERGRPALPRAAVMRKLTELLDVQSGQPTYAGELAQAVGVSDATLRRMFIELFDMPPARYLMIKRLYLARQALRSGRFETVGQVAEALGFWDHGRFAGRYKQLFKVLPIETLRSARKT